MTTIGLPRAFLYYKYRYLWETFFSELGFKTICSEETTKKTVSDGIHLSIDECCLPSKIYMGHIQSLIGKCDYILVPRIVSFGKREETCVKFNAVYDIVRNTFQEIQLLDYNVDAVNGDSEQKGFINMGRYLGKSYFETYKAYKKSKKYQLLKDKEAAELQEELLSRGDKFKILIVSHPYNTYDRLIGYPVVNYLKELNAVPVYADMADSRESIKKSKEITSNLYWTYSKELIGSISLYKDKIDGVVFLTAFPCGPDSLVNEYVIRKMKDLPMVNLIIDELQSDAGLQTRIESFIDILNAKRMERI